MASARWHIKIPTHKHQWLPHWLFPLFPSLVVFTIFIYLKKRLPFTWRHDYCISPLAPQWFSSQMDHYILNHFFLMIFPRKHVRNAQSPRYVQPFTNFEQLWTTSHGVVSWTMEGQSLASLPPLFLSFHWKLSSIPASFPQPAPMCHFPPFAALNRLHSHLPKLFLQKPLVLSICWNKIGESPPATRPCFLSSSLLSDFSCSLSAGVVFPLGTYSHFFRLPY